MAMKKLSIIMTALAMLLAMTQCKKNDEPNPAGTGGEPVNITLEVKGNDNGSKVVVDPSTGTVNFENGDAIYVASGGKYVGTLTYNGTVFSGAISNAVEGAPLQFYFLGNVTPAETLTSGVTESCSVVISDQTQHLPVISAAASNENYVASQPNYTARLLNKCALVKFNVTTSSSAATCITGLNNKMTVNFSTNSLTPGLEGTGIIKLSAGNGDKWAVLLPQEALGEGESGSAFSEDCAYAGVRKALPAIAENDYLHEGLLVSINTSLNTNYIPGIFNPYEMFTINEMGGRVLFSSGNLQYLPLTNTWRFAENQYEYIGDGNENISLTYNGWIDLFGWGTSGWNNGNTYYYPWNWEIGDLEEYGYGYGPIDQTNFLINLIGPYANADWGVFNGISNGANVPKQWRTLTQEEWDFVLNHRGDYSFCKVKLNNVNGVILLPDGWVDYHGQDFVFNEINNPNADFDSNILSANDWWYLEQYGVIFLPSAGFRDEKSVNYFGSRGFYWSASTTGAGNACGLFFDEQELNSNYIEGHRGLGYSVRLVRDAQ